MTPDSQDVFDADPAHPVLPSEIRGPGPEEGEFVVLLADAGAREGGWAASLTVQLARRWSEAGTRVVVADADFDEASLSMHIGAEVGEGLSDLLLYGSSPARVASQVGEEAFRFIPAGTIVGDPAGAWSARGWDGLQAAFREARTTLVVHLPEEGEVDDLVQRADRVLRLASDNGPGRLVHPDATIVRGEPRAAGAEDGPLAGAELPQETPVMMAGAPAPEAVGTPEPGAATGPDEVGATPTVASTAGAVPDSVAPGAPPAPEKVGPRGASASPQKGVPGWLPLLILILLGIALVAAAWFGVVEIPGIGSGASVAPGAESLARLARLDPSG